MLTENACTILIGPTQAGKSSFIATLQPPNAPNSPAVGRPGTGRSVTQTCESFETSIGLVLDSPGYNTDRTVEIEQFTHEATSVLDQCKGVRFVIVDSVANDAISLRATKEILDKAFGKSIENSVVVLATKKDRLDEDELAERLISMKKCLEPLGLTNCAIIPWTSKAPTSDEIARQIEELTVALGATELTRLCKPEIGARGDHIMTPDGLHAIVLHARYNGMDSKWKITVALLAQDTDTPIVQTCDFSANQTKDNKVSVGGQVEGAALEMAATRAEFLNLRPDLASLSPTQSSSECFAAWCRVGKWAPCSIRGNLSAANLVTKGAPGIGISGLLAGCSVEVAAGGIYGFLGGTVLMPLGPILVPIVLGGTAVCCTKDYMNNKNAWDRHGNMLSKEFDQEHKFDRPLSCNAENPAKY